jgi:hypothetical protein
MLFQFFQRLTNHHYQDTSYIKKPINNNALGFNIESQVVPQQTLPTFRYTFNIFLRENYKIFSHNKIIVKTNYKQKTGTILTYIYYYICIITCYKN